MRRAGFRLDEDSQASGSEPALSKKQDDRHFQIAVAGRAALLVAKRHKLAGSPVRTLA